MVKGDTVVERRNFGMVLPSRNLISKPQSSLLDQKEKIGKVQTLQFVTLRHAHVNKGRRKGSQSDNK